MGMFLESVIVRILRMTKIIRKNIIIFLSEIVRISYKVRTKIVRFNILIVINLMIDLTVIIIIIMLRILYR